ncbi:mycothiol system anti-sigma-R factor [Dietzia sp. CH92]|uniref:mycothiol system anti-sigma-R factor n=1 Tax=Dietzia sp. CH92 TaxID=3051823 RepID=UPI0028D35816|nr:mycothiol system anti-sigma-R factor [Dietzia sp. CH92]
MREHDPRLDEIDCRAAMRDLSLLVDLECDDACRSRLEHHLAGCPDCREMFLSERRLKAKISSSCCEKAPSGLRERLMVEIRRTTVTTTDADGTTVVHQRTTVERRDLT